MSREVAGGGSEFAVPTLDVRSQIYSCCRTPLTQLLSPPERGPFLPLPHCTHPSLPLSLSPAPACLDYGGFCVAASTRSLPLPLISRAQKELAAKTGDALI